jgi:hypothetical protein
MSFVRGCRVTLAANKTRQGYSMLSSESVRLCHSERESAQLAAMSIQRTGESSRLFGSTTPPVSTSPMVTSSPSTPPAPFTSPTPLTPPSSKQKARTRRTVLEDIIQEIENRKFGRGRSTNPWLRFKLSSSDYEHLQQRYQEDGFVQDKLRYVALRGMLFLEAF